MYVIWKKMKIFYSFGSSCVFSTSLLKWQFTHKWKYCHNLLITMFFQTLSSVTMSLQLKLMRSSAILDLTGIHNVQKKLKHPLKYLLYSAKEIMSLSYRYVKLNTCLSILNLSKPFEQKWTFFPFGIEPFQTKQNCMVSFPLFFCLSRAGRCLTVWSADCVSPPTSSNLIKACSSSLSSNNLLFTLLSLPFSFSFPHSRSSLYPLYYSALDFGERTLKMRKCTLGSRGVTEKDAGQFHCVTLLSGDFNCFWFIRM